MIRRRAECKYQIGEFEHSAAYHSTAQQNTAQHSTLQPNALAIQQKETIVPDDTSVRCNAIQRNTTHTGIPVQTFGEPLNTSSHYYISHTRCTIPPQPGNGAGLCGGYSRTTLQTFPLFHTAMNSGCSSEPTEDVSPQIPDALGSFHASRAARYCAPISPLSHGSYQRYKHPAACWAMGICLSCCPLDCNAPKSWHKGGESPIEDGIAADAANWSRTTHNRSPASLLPNAEPLITRPGWHPQRENGGKLGENGGKWGNI